MSTLKLEKLKANIRDLLEEPPKTKAGIVVSRWPVISEALAKGHKMGAIWNRLQADGLEMKYNEFRAYVSRMRKKHGLPQGREKKETPRPTGVVPVSSAAESAARAREHLRKAQGIEWKGTKDVDPKKLF